MSYFTAFKEGSVSGINLDVLLITVTYTRMAFLILYTGPILTVFCFITYSLEYVSIWFNRNTLIFWSGCESLTQYINVGKFPNFFSLILMLRFIVLIKTEWRIKSCICMSPFFRWFEIYCSCSNPASELIFQCRPLVDLEFHKNLHWTIVWKYEM